MHIESQRAAGGEVLDVLEDPDSLETHRSSSPRRFDVVEFINGAPSVYRAPAQTLDAVASTRLGRSASIAD